MALNIRNVGTERLATRLAKLTGESKTEAVTKALRDRLAKVTSDRHGRHPAGLNFGDCFAYALATDRGEPLLFKGGDFDKTDVFHG